MTDIFQEVDEEVRRDKAVEFWTKYQNYILAAALIIVLATGGYRFWRHYELQQAQAAGAQFQEALRLDAAGKSDEAQAALAKLGRSRPARLRQPLPLSRGRPLTLKKDPKAGIAAYDALARTPRSIRCCATRRDCAPRSPGSTTARTDAAKAALEPLAGSGVYRATARLALASLALGAKTTSRPASGSKR